MKRVFDNSLSSSSAQLFRLNEEDLINQKNNDGLTIIHLLMSAHILKLKSFQQLCYGNKYDRMEFINYLITTYPTQFSTLFSSNLLSYLDINADINSNSNLTSNSNTNSNLNLNANLNSNNTDIYGFTNMHAASLLFQGLTSMRILSPQELRSKRVKSYPSLELKILDILFSGEVRTYEH